MEQPIQASQHDSDGQTRALESQIRECYGRVVYSHTVHEKCADIYLKRLNLIKNGQIILSAITTGTLLISLFGEGKLGTIIGAIFSTILLALNTYTKDYDLEKLAQKHSDTAAKLWGIRESYLSLLTDMVINSLSLDQVQAKRDALQNLLESVYQNAPRTIEQAYRLAQKALKVDEQMTFSNEEINNFLPNTLRINS
jgi:hypothetical protein